MPELTLQNIDQISRDVMAQEITFSHLPDELTDHICCAVEFEMQKGMSFQEAYQFVRQKMGKRRLKEIQEETLYAVDTKYRQMKTTMKISGVAGTIMFGLSALFKIQHWPGAAILMTLGALTLALVFLPSALSVLWKETHNSRKLFLFISAFLTGAFFIAGTLFKIQHWPLAGTILLLGTTSGILFIAALLINRFNDQENKSKRPAYFLGAAGFVLYVIGIFFKIQHWPLATVFMVIGLLILCIIVFPWYTWLTWKEADHISSTFIFLVVGFLLIIIPGALVNLNLQHNYQNTYFPVNDQQNSLFNYLNNNNSSMVSRYRDSSNYKNLEHLQTRTSGVIEVINHIQEEMILFTEGKSRNPEVSADQFYNDKTDHKILYRKLSNPFNIIAVRVYLLPDCKSRRDINDAMAGYLNYLTGLVPGEETGRYRKLLDPSTYLPGNDPENSMMSLMSGLHALEVMKNGILTVESCVLNETARAK